MALSRPNWLDPLWFALALMLGSLVAYLSWHTDDDGIVAGLLFVFALVLGVGRPVGAWRWAVVLGLCIPASEWLRPVLGQPMLGSTSSPLGFLLLAAFTLTVAFIGTYVGVGLRKLAN